jgi:hypothetical protein
MQLLSAAVQPQSFNHHHHHQITKLSHSINAIGLAPHPQSFNINSVISRTRPLHLLLAS